jgi:hypothetical protein
MKDELRWIPYDFGKVMIGIGYIDWSGGVWNASPFLLYIMPSPEWREYFAILLYVFSSWECTAMILLDLTCGLGMQCLM